MSTWYQITNAETVDSPALLIYPSRMVNNIRAARKISADYATMLRPHVKTHKTREVAEIMLAEGIKKFKCATISEAEMLALAGTRDILLAYQPTLIKARRLRVLADAYPDVRFSCLVDNPSSIEMLAEVFQGKKLEVFIDLNTGMDRTGIAPANASSLYQHCRNFKHIQIAGLHAYDGHIQDANERRRKQQADETYRLAEETRREIASIHLETTALTLILGGSPTFPFHAQRKNVECSPGTFIYWDEGYGTRFPDLPFEYAALLLTRVISIIDKGRICLDLGHKSVGAENSLDKRVRFLNEPEAELLSQSEEHLVVRVEDSGKHRIGDTWYGLPWHICPSVALYQYAHVVRNGKVMEKWKISARNRE